MYISVANCDWYWVGVFCVLNNSPKVFNWGRSCLYLNKTYDMVSKQRSPVVELNWVNIKAWMFLLYDIRLFWEASVNYDLYQNKEIVVKKLNWDNKLYHDLTKEERTTPFSATTEWLIRILWLEKSAIFCHVDSPLLFDHYSCKYTVHSKIASTKST